MICHICTRSTWYSVVHSARSMSLTYNPVEFATEYTKDHTNLCGMSHPVGWQTDNRFIYLYIKRICIQHPVLQSGHTWSHTDGLTDGHTNEIII